MQWLGLGLGLAAPSAVGMTTRRPSHPLKAAWTYPSRSPGPRVSWCGKRASGARVSGLVDWWLLWYVCVRVRVSVSVPVRSDVQIQEHPTNQQLARVCGGCASLLFAASVFTQAIGVSMEKKNRYSVALLPPDKEVGMFSRGGMFMQTRITSNFPLAAHTCSSRHGAPCPLWCAWLM